MRWSKKKPTKTRKCGGCAGRGEVTRRVAEEFHTEVCMKCKGSGRVEVEVPEPPKIKVLDADGKPVADLTGAVTDVQFKPDSDTTLRGKLNISEEQAKELMAKITRDAGRAIVYPVMPTTTANVILNGQDFHVSDETYSAIKKIAAANDPQAISPTHGMVHDPLRGKTEADAPPGPMADHLLVAFDKQFVGELKPHIVNVEMRQDHDDFFTDMGGSRRIRGAVRHSCMIEVHFS